jgi:type VI secretion system protein ImpE
MQAEGLLREGRLLEALAALEDDVRRNPSDPRLRTFLFQLLCVLGHWERAITQAEVSAELDPGRLLLARMYQPAAACEVFREEVFAGRRSPMCILPPVTHRGLNMVLGEPPAWVAWLIQATHLAAAGRFAAAADLRDRALDAAPAVAGTINDKPFQWLFDADSRLGPVLEAILDGKYYWIPFDRIRCISLEPPQDLRDLVWAPAAFTWANGGQAAGLIPVRYPSSHTSETADLLMARNTSWTVREGDFRLGMGERVWATDAEDYPMLQVRRIAMGSSGEAGEEKGDG